MTLIIERNNINVWFECKSCQFTFPFRTVAEFLDHKEQEHYLEFQRTQCIVFEERKQDVPSRSQCHNQNVKETNLFAPDDSSSEIDDELFSDNANNKQRIFSLLAEPSLTMTIPVSPVPDPVANPLPVVLVPEPGSSILSASHTRAIDTVSAATKLNKNPGQNSDPESNAEIGLFSLSSTLLPDNNSESPPKNPYVLIRRLTSKELLHSNVIVVSSSFSRKTNIKTRKKCNKLIIFKSTSTKNKIKGARKYKKQELNCHVCSKKFSGSTGLRLHLQSHVSQEERERNKPFVCEVCGKSFIHNFRLKNHQLTHGEARPFKCSHPNCSAAFKLNNILQSHLKTHAESKLFICPKEGCAKSFRTRHDLTVHLTSLLHTGNSLPKTWKCTEENCGRLYIHKLSLERHMIAAHGIGGELPTFQCHICVKSFTWKTSLAKHLLMTHSEDKPFKCTYEGCDKAYKVKGSLVEHVHGKHTGERPYQCDLCGKAYYTRVSFNWHMGVHQKSNRREEERDPQQPTSTPS